MQKFLVLYCMPISGLEEWQKIAPEKRKADEERLKAKWDAWAKAYRKELSGETVGVGKTKRVTTRGVSDAKNDLMLYTIVEADSHEAVAKMFESHPHLEIPGAWIDISAINRLPRMERM